ncbi:MAG: cupin domain-containing protein [Candidatus Nitrosocosmicus sp.]|nr:cupin domain-containing protein [Candidatus Nitrosocosmicus sp.]
MMQKNIIDANSVLSKLDKMDVNSYFLNFMSNKSFEVGIIRLSPNQTDTQGTHSVDELYFVIEGEGYINIQEKDHPIKKGSCIFVRSNSKHHFHGNKEQLVVLYVFNVSNR